jgi:antitoxin PrlF
MSLIETTSRLTSQNQTTIPVAVRKALGLNSNDRIKFVIMGDGKVELAKDETETADVTVAAYLKFLEDDIIANPQKLSVLERDEELAAKLANVETDIEL